MKPAPAFDCAACGRHIGKTSGHYLLDDQAVICVRCAERRTLHNTMRPDCPHRWHDLLDHLASTGTRAGIAAALGMWP